MTPNPCVMTYLEDGHCSLSNNMSENSIRRANGLNPQGYLEYLLEVRPDKDMSDEELETYAPWNK